jgi:hypothetical protein
MKTCLLCNTESADDVATCPNDGEASWSDAVVQSADASADADADAPVDADASVEPAKKRSRR